jgi:wyosine [tRNA(Phe)-imidazoG37] synthetase (radical SAM superfamily)
MKNKTDLKDFVCWFPFGFTEITHDRQTLCCSGWLTKDIGSNKNLKENWDSDTANEIRESVLDGSFKYCKKDTCPFLSTVINSGLPAGPILRKNEIGLKGVIDLDGYKKRHPTLDADETFGYPDTPRQFKVVWDSTCNLACPSCRPNFITNTEGNTLNTEEILQDIITHYGRGVKSMTMSGYGDPFYSTGLFKFLQSFKKEDWPNLNNIHLHTNALLWNSRNWDIIKHSHSFINSAEISIDAATKETYQVVRRGGKWDLLLKNLQFISTLDLREITFSYVVQTENYKEMIYFYKLIKEIFKDSSINILFYYYKILDWGVMDSVQYEEAAVWKDTHPLYNDFQKEVKEFIKIHDDSVSHSLWDYEGNNDIL